MKGKLKKLLGIAVGISAMVTSTVYGGNMVSLKLYYDGKMHDYKAEEITISLDGKTVATGDMPPVIIDERTLVPARAVFEAMGGVVAWNQDTKEVFVNKGDDIVVLQIDNKSGTKNGNKFSMDVPAKIINERTMIPVRAVSEALGADVGWDGTKRLVSIYDKTTSTPTPTNIAVTGVTVPAKSGVQDFTVRTSGTIGKYENLYVDDTKIVLDFYSATKGIADTVSANESPVVSAIRSAQHEADGVTMTRVVFDLKTAGTKYTVTKGTDGKSVVVHFEKNSVTSLATSNSGGKDMVTLQGQIALGAKVTTLSNPKRLVIDVPYSESALEASPSAADLSYIKGIRTSNYENGTRVVLEVSDLVEYKVNQSGTTLKLEVYQSSLKGMAYDSSTQTLTLDNPKGLNPNQITHTDNYLLKEYQLTLPGNYQDVYGYGTYPIGDGNVASIEVGTSGNTVLTFKTKTIQAVQVIQSGNVLQIQIKNPKQVYDRVLVLDAGHGGTAPGASGNGLVEKQLTLAFAKKVEMYLKQNGSVKVYMTRVGDATTDNAMRASMANEIADAFVSIHMNSASPNPVPNGTETLYKTHTTDVAGKLTSKIAANTIQNSLVSAFGTNNRGLKYRDDLLVLNSTKVPAVLIEVGFLSNPGDALKLSQESSQNTGAKAIADGIIAMMTQNKLR